MTRRFNFSDFLTAFKENLANWRLEFEELTKDGGMLEISMIMKELPGKGMGSIYRDSRILGYFSAYMTRHGVQTIIKL